MWEQERWGQTSERMVVPRRFYPASCGLSVSPYHSAARDVGQTQPGRRFVALRATAECGVAPGIAKKPPQRKSPSSALRFRRIVRVSLQELHGKLTGEPERCALTIAMASAAAGVSSA